MPGCGSGWRLAYHNAPVSRLVGQTPSNRAFVALFVGRLLAEEP